MHIQPRLIVSLTCLIGSVLAGQDRMVQHRRVPHSGLARRQIVVGGGGQNAASATSTTATDNGGNNAGGNGGNQAAQTTTTAQQQQQGNNGNGQNANSIVVSLDPKEITSTAPVPTITVQPSTSKAATTSKASSTGPLVVNITQTSTQQPSSTVSQLAASTSAAASSSSSGLGKGTIIAVGVVAGSVALVAAIWTIFRKWKLGPSRRFEDKLQPVELFDPAGPEARRLGAGFDARGGPQYGTSGGLSRMDSTGSGSLEGVKRAGSLGSAHGSQIGSLRGAHHPAMSEVSYGGQQQAPYYPPASHFEQQPYPVQRSGTLHNPYASHDFNDQQHDDATYGARAVGGGYARY